MQLQRVQIGDYIIVKKIGEGGMSVVYLAEARRDRTQVVVKQLKEHLAFDKQLVGRFAQGAKIMQQLRHPNLAQVLDYMERDGGYFTVEEYLSGGSLAELIDQRSTISEKQALGWCRDALHAVNYAHENRIVHRDLKPNNLMLNEKGEVKVTDFGIAKVFGGARLTRTGDQMGTTVYMSPEQIRSTDQIDHLTDVYSMGVVLYELLTGRVPFDSGNEFEIMQAVVQKPPVPPRKLNARVSPQAERIVLKAMHKRPEDRFSGCGEFALEIDRRCLRPTKRKGRGPSHEKLVQRMKNHPIAISFILLLLVIVLALIVPPPVPSDSIPSELAADPSKPTAGADPSQQPVASAGQSKPAAGADPNKPAAGADQSKQPADQGQPTVPTERSTTVDGKPGTESKGASKQNVMLVLILSHDLKEASSLKKDIDLVLLQSGQKLEGRVVREYEAAPEVPPKAFIFYPDKGLKEDAKQLAIVLKKQQKFKEIDRHLDAYKSRKRLQSFAEKQLSGQEKYLLIVLPPTGK